MGSISKLSDIIDNDNERFKKKETMTMSMNGVNWDGVLEEKRPESEVERMADWLAEELDSPNSRPQYCDFARYLTVGFIENAVRIATKTPGVMNHGAYFGAICRPKLRFAKQMYAQGILPRSV